MNDKFDELRIRIQAADPAQNAPELNHTLVAKAPLAKKAKSLFGFKVARLGLGGASAVAVTALALTLSANLGAQPLIQMAAGGPESLAPGGAKVMAGSDAMVGMWPGYWVQNEYTAGNGLSDETGRGNIYQLVMVGTAQERLQQIADLFGVAGPIREEEWSSPDYPSFAIGTQNTQVGVSWASTGGWSYSNWRDQVYECIDGSKDFDTCEYVSPEPTPELLPSEAEVIAKALEIFRATGLDVSAQDIRTYRDDWGTGATASLKVDGQDTALDWSISYDSAGNLTYAYGHSVEVISRGDFKTISAFDAVDRIPDVRWWGSRASSVWDLFGDQNIGIQAEPFLDSDMSVLPETSEPLDGSVTEELGPDESEPEVRVVQFTITDSTQVMLMIYDKSGSAWLVPGYLLHNDQGWFDNVISLEEGVIELYDPIEMDPANLRMGGDSMVG